MAAGWSLPKQLSERLTPKLAERFFAWTAWAIGALALGSGFYLALVHLSDRYGISHVHGAWLALAELAAHGNWYPAPFDGHYYAGTRFMPLSIGTLALFSRVFSDPLLGSKLAALVTMTALLWMVARSLLRAGLPRPYALAGTGLVLLCSPGLWGLTAYRGDVLPVFLQLVALELVDRATPSRSAWTGAGCLAALAVLAKMSALWGGTALGLLALLQPRRALLPYLAGLMATLAVGLVGTELLSGGHFLENILGLSGSGLGGVLRAPGKLHYLWIESSLVSWVLLIPVGYGLLRSLGRGRLELLQLAFLGAVALLVVILADAGTYSNHLIDVVVLSVLLAGRVLANELQTENGRSLSLFFGVLVLIAALAGFDRVTADELRAGREVPERDLLDEPLAGGGSILSEDPTISVLRGERPVVLDSWMYLRWAARHPEAEAALIARIEQQEFAHLVLLRDPANAAEWYRVQAFGPAVIAAMLRAYEPEGVVHGYHLFRPRSRSP